MKAYIFCLKYRHKFCICIGLLECFSVHPVGYFENLTKLPKGILYNPVITKRIYLPVVCLTTKTTSYKWASSNVFPDFTNRLTGHYILSQSLCSINIFIFSSLPMSFGLCGCMYALLLQFFYVPMFMLVHTVPM